jgi:hypothetical protein
MIKYRVRYFTNFVTDIETNKVLLALDYDRPIDSLRGALEWDGIPGIKVERVGPLSDAPLFETPSDWEPEAVRNRVAY